MTAKDLVIEYSRKWKEKYGQSYTISWAKEISQVKRLLKSHDATTLLSYMEYFICQYRSDFADSAGRHIGVFITSLPAVIVEMNKKQVADAKLHTTADDYQRLEEARKKLEKS